MTRILTILALAICLCSSAMAGLTINDQVNVQFNGIGSGSNVTIKTGQSYPGQGRPGHEGNSPWTNTTAGLMDLLVDGDNYEGFCIDLAQSTSSSSENYTVQSLQDALSTTQAQALADILNQWTDGMSATQYAGMQLAIWEVVSEEASNSYSLNGGYFSVAQWNVSQEVLSYATDYLSYAGKNVGDTSDYLALTSGTYQDFVVRASAVPAPGAILLGGFGGLLVAKIRRRRMS